MLHARRAAASAQRHRFDFATTIYESEVFTFSIGAHRLRDVTLLYALDILMLMIYHDAAAVTRRCGAAIYAPSSNTIRKRFCDLFSPMTREHLRNEAAPRREIYALPFIFLMMSASPLLDIASFRACIFQPRPDISISDEWAPLTRFLVLPTAPAGRCAIHAARWACASRNCNIALRRQNTIEPSAILISPRYV